MSRTQSYLAAGLAGLVLGAAALAAALAASGPTSALHRWLTPAGAPGVAGLPAGAPRSFADLYERVSPAVVSIYSTAVTPPAVLLPDAPFGAPQVAPPMQARSSGSGFFISADGYILTNNHVVEGAEDIEAVLLDGRRLPARLVGRDAASDLAVLKVDGGAYPFVSFAESTTPRVGDWVIAIGNPFGLGSTATAGIVSAYGRNIGSAFVDYLQLDAPINQGNSGGPTFDVQGRVVGVNTAIVSPTGGFIGIGFAIPADVAREVSQQLIAGRPVQRGYLGAMTQDLTPRTAQALGITAREGALVISVDPSGPAARAGLRPGDVIVSVNDQAVEDASAVTRAVVRQDPGATVTLGLLRAGRPHEISIRAGVRPPAP